MNEQYSYSYGFVYQKDKFYVAAQDKNLHESDLEHTFIFQFEGEEVYQWEIEAETISMAYFDTVDKGRVGVVICTDGSAIVDDSEGLKWEAIHKGEDAPNSMRPLLASRIIGKNLYVTGMLRQVFTRSIRSGKWSRKDKGLLPQSSDDLDVGFEDIDGFSENEIYAVGLKGQIWMFDGNNWIQLSSPTNRNLASLKCAPDGLVYVVGDEGVILRGRKESWELIDQELTTESFSCIEHAFGSLFIAENGKKLYRYAENTFMEVQTDLDKPVTTYHLHSNDELLLSVGAADIVLYDGKKWLRKNET